MNDQSAESAAPTLLEQHLASHEEQCPMCGYNLHNLRGRRCPECGQELTLHVALAEPRLGAFYTGMVGLAAGFGFTSLVLLWGAVALARRGGPEPWQLLLLFVESVVLGAMLLTWIRKGAAIRRLPPAARQLLAALAWLAAVMAVLIFGMAVEY